MAEEKKGRFGKVLKSILLVGIGVVLGVTVTTDERKRTMVESFKNATNSAKGWIAGLCTKKADEATSAEVENN